MSKPLSPEEIGHLKTEKIPPEVFSAFNHVIAKHWDGKFAEFTQDEVIVEILRRMPDGTKRHELFKNKWLDVEGSYREAGWAVDYDKPGFNESYLAKFRFQRRGR